MVRRIKCLPKGVRTFGCFFIVFILFILLILSLSPISLISQQSSSFTTAAESKKQVLADLDQDGIEEEYQLSGSSLTIYEGADETKLWQSPRTWTIDSFVLGDVNHDGRLNLVLILWKKGSFGPVKPFWYEKEDISYKQHLFVLQLEENKMHEVWCSSNLDKPIVALTIDDVDRDGRNELAVEEGRYRKVYGEHYALDKHAPTQQTLWRWEDWGFRKVDSALRFF